MRKKEILEMIFGGTRENAWGITAFTTTRYKLT
jgi:hypothetical protein